MLQTHGGQSWTHLEPEPATEDGGGGTAPISSPRLGAGSGGGGGYTNQVSKAAKGSSSLNKDWTL